MRRISASSYVWHGVRTLAFFRIVQFFSKGFGNVPGFLLGGVVYKLGASFIDYFVSAVSGMEKLTGLDEHFLVHENSGNLSNVTIVVGCSKFKNQQMKDYLFKEFSKLPRAKSQVVEFAGRFFMSDISEK